jgi:hypothetical protein
MSHRRSGLCPKRICVNDDRYAAFTYISKCNTLCTDLVHTVEIVEIPNGMLLNLRRRTWSRKGEEVGVYLPKPGEMIYML